MRERGSVNIGTLLRYLSAKSQLAIRWSDVDVISLASIDMEFPDPHCAYQRNGFKVIDFETIG
jgi:hypothetical protein